MSAWAYTLIPAAAIVAGAAVPFGNTISAIKSRVCITAEIAARGLQRQPGPARAVASSPTPGSS